MITYPINFPETICALDGLQIVPRNAVSSSESPFTFERQTYEFPGEMWTIQGSLRLMQREDAEAYVSFMIKLKGQRGTFLFPLPPPLNTPRGVATGTPLVDGGSQTGNTLNIKGMTAGITGIFRQGDFIQIGTGGSTRLYKILDDANSDGSGDVTVTIWPALRTSPADETPVVVSGCKGLFRLTQDTGVNISVDKFHALSFAAVEAL